MKKVLLLILAACIGVVANAQEIPYSKYLKFDNAEFKANRFKYDDETNTWGLRRVNGWNTAFNVLAILGNGIEDVRPSQNDYRIVVQCGKEDKASFVKVVCYSDETYHKLLTFVKTHGQNIVETSSGKLTRYQATCGDYALELNLEQHIISRTSARTVDSKALKMLMSHTTSMNLSSEQMLSLGRDTSKGRRLKRQNAKQRVRNSEM